MRVVVYREKNHWKRTFEKQSSFNDDDVFFLTVSWCELNLKGMFETNFELAFLSLKPILIGVLKFETNF